MSVLQRCLKLSSQLIMSLGLGVSSALATTAALAAPAPVFEPILDEVSQAGTLLRLPTTIPTNIELYPSTIPQTNIVILDTEPDCEGIECTALVVVKESEPPPLWPFIGANPFETINLADGVQAHFWERDGMASWQWVQDDAFYVLTYNQEHFSKEEGLAMATSMATELPFTP